MKGLWLYGPVLLECMLSNIKEGTLYDMSFHIGLGVIGYTAMGEM